MKKLFLILAALAVAFAATAADRFAGTFTIPATATSGAYTQELTKAWGPPCLTIDSVFADVYSGGGTGTVSFSVSEFGRTDTAFATSSAMYSGQSFFDNAIVTETVTAVNFIPYTVSTNAPTLAVGLMRYTNVTAVAKSPIARRVIVSATQLAVSTDTVYRFAIIVKEDPPAAPQK